MRCAWATNVFLSTRLGRKSRFPWPLLTPCCLSGEERPYWFRHLRTTPGSSSRKKSMVSRLSVQTSTSPSERSASLCLGPLAKASLPKPRVGALHPCTSSMPFLTCCVTKCLFQPSALTPHSNMFLVFELVCATVASINPRSDTVQQSSQPVDQNAST